MGANIRCEGRAGHPAGMRASRHVPPPPLQPLWGNPSPYTVDWGLLILARCPRQLPAPLGLETSGPRSEGRERYILGIQNGSQRPNPRKPQRTLSTIWGLQDALAPVSFPPLLEQVWA